MEGHNARFDLLAIRDKEQRSEALRGEGQTYK